MAVAIFAVTFLFLAGSGLPFLKLDRPGAALVGAMLMVGAGVVTPAEVFNHSSDEARHAVDLNTLVLLLGMMLLASYLSHAAFFRAHPLAARPVHGLQRKSPSGATSRWEPR